MILRSLRFRDWRSHKLTKIEGLARVNYFGGMNRVGKSGVADGLMMLLTGGCRGVEHGRDSGRLRYSPGGVPSEQKWKVGAVVQNPNGPNDPTIEISRQEGEGPKSKAQLYIERFVEIPAHLVRASLDSSRIISLAHEDPKKAQSLLVELIKPMEGIEVDEELQRLINRHLTSEGMADFRLEDVDRLYDEAYKLRREANKVVKATEITLPSLGEDDAKLEKMTLPQLKKTREMVTSKVAEYNESQTSINTALHEANQQSAVLESTLEEAEAAVEAAKVAVATAPSVAEITSEVARISKELKGLNQKRDTLVSKASELAATRAMAADHVSSLASKILKFKDLKKGAACPTCTQLLEPTLHDRVLGEMKKAREKQQEKVTAVQGALESAHRELEELPDPNTLSAELDLIQGSEDAYTMAQKALDTAVETRDKEKVRHDGWAKTGPDALRELEQRLSTNAASIKEGSRRLEVLSERISALETVAKIKKQGKGAKGKAEELQTLVEQLGPKGDVRTQFTTSDRAGDFFKFMEGALGGLGFDAVDFGPLLSLKGEIVVDSRPVSVLSESERLLFGIAFQVAVAKWTGIEIVMVDRWEALDMEYAKKAQRLLDKSGHQVFIFAVLRRPVEEFRAHAVKVNKNPTLGTRVFVCEKPEGKASTVKALVK